MMKLERLLRVIVFGAEVALAGCVRYQASPIDWIAEETTWTNAACSVDLPREAARLRALAYAPELNALRVAHATSKAKAQAAGYWRDPEFNLEFLRVLKEPENPLTYGGSFVFTIPVTGIPGLERRAAEAYAEADRWEIAAAEYAAGTEAEILSYTARSLSQTMETLAAGRASAAYRDARRVSEQLVEVGEMTRTELAHQAMAEQDLERTLFELRDELRAAEAGLRRLTGLSPNCTFIWTTADTLPEIAKDDPPWRAFIDAPQVKAARTKLDAKEIELEKEIRRQYPEIALGPAYTREDGHDKIGFSLDLSLPLWNRNREGIAESKGLRVEARYVAVNAWRDVVLDYCGLRRAQVKLQEEQIALQKDRQTHDAHREEVKRLYAAGELTAGEYVACRQQEWNWCVNAMRRHLVFAENTLRLSGILRSLEGK